MAPILPRTPQTDAIVRQNATGHTLDGVQNEARNGEEEQEERPNGTADTEFTRGKKRKRKEKPHILHSTTFRKPTWTYFHLSLITPSTASTSTTISTTTSANPSSTPIPSPTSSDIDIDIDALTVSTLLNAPLQSFLGLLGSSIPIDIVKTQGREVWIRIPWQDARGLRGSLSNWVGSCEGDLVPGSGAGGGEGRVKVAWRVLGEGRSLGILGSGGSGGRDLVKTCEGGLGEE